MAVFKSALITEASGSIGGMTLSHNRGGMYIRARTIPTNPNTPDQAAVRAAFSALTNRWANTLSPPQRNTWFFYAAQVPLIGPLGDPITVSGFNHYIRSNSMRARAGLAIIDNAPGIFNLGTLSAVSVSNATEAAQTVDVTFTEADGWNIANGHLMVYQSRPVSPTIEFFRGPYGRMPLISGIAVSPTTIAAQFAFVAGQRLYFRARASLADGRLTAEQFIGPVTAIA